jgi:hypothetical protein
VRHVYVAGDIAQIVVDWSIDGTGPDGEQVHFGGSACDIVRRGADGRWRYLIDKIKGRRCDSLPDTCAPRISPSRIRLSRLRASCSSASAWARVIHTVSPVAEMLSRIIHVRVEFIKFGSNHYSVRRNWVIV